MTVPAFDDSWGAADDAFALFLATITPSDFNDWEFRAFQWHRLQGLPTPTRRTA